MLSCAQEKELTIRTSFYENCNEFLLSDDPDLLDMLDYVLTLEYPVSIVSSDGNNYPELCEQIQRDMLERIFGKEATDAAYKGKLAKDPMVREPEDAFVSRSKNLILDRNERIKKEYLQQFGLRDKNGETFKSLGHKVYLHEVVCFLAYHYKDIISYHIHWNINQYGKAHSYERGYNYALDGQLISEKEFFTEEGITEILPQLLTEEFERYPMTAKIPHFQAQITPNGNFKLSPKGIIYMYDAGEIADAQHGILRITLPWDKVEEIIKLS